MENEIWVVDDVTSPCIDAGDTTSPVGWLEPFPNAGVVNMGRLWQIIGWLIITRRLFRAV